MIGKYWQIRTVGRFFMVGGGGGGVEEGGQREGLSKNVGPYCSPTIKNKEKYWLKRPKAVSQKTIFKQNINYSKSHT